MMILLLLFALTIELDTVDLPLNSAVKITFAPSGKAELKREGTVTYVKIEVDQLRAPIAPLNTYVVWAISPEGIFENLGELQALRAEKLLNGGLLICNFLVASIVVLDDVIRRE